jgi:hypothetical protein
MKMGSGAWGGGRRGLDRGGGSRGFERVMVVFGSRGGDSRGFERGGGGRERGGGLERGGGRPFFAGVARQRRVALRNGVGG